MQAFDKRGNDRTTFLQHNAGQDPIEDARMSGYVLAVKDLLLVDFEETQE